jgi:hypothetical protein
LMAFAIDGNPPNLCIFSFIVFLFGLPLTLGKWQSPCLEWNYIRCLVIWLTEWTSSFLSTKTEVWCYCVTKIMSRLSKFTTWGQGKQEAWYMPLLTPIIFFVLPRMLWNLSYHDHEEGGTLNTLHFYVLHGTSFIFVLLPWYYFQVCDTSLGNVILIYTINFF